MALASVRRFLQQGGVIYLYAVFLAGYFLLPMAAGHRRVYYLLVLPAALLLWRDLAALGRENAVACLVVLYAGYMTVTLAWSADFDMGEALRAAGYGICVVSFVMVTGYLWLHHPQRMGLLAERAVWLAGGAAAVSMVVWYLSHPFPESRLEPLGVMHHPNKSGSAYGLFLVLAVHFAGRAGRRRERLGHVAAAAVLLCLVVLTQSRTALLAVSVGLIALLGLRALALLVPAVAASWAALASAPGLWQDRVTRFSFRPGIWQQVFSDAREHFWFGQGLLVDPTVAAYGKLFSHAHNGYLAALRDGGAVGLALLLALLAVALRWAWQLRARSGERIYLALLLYGVTSLLTDYDRLLVQPKELWLFFWLPVALVMAAPPAGGRSVAAVSGGHAYQ